MSADPFPENFDSLWLNGRLATMAGDVPYGIIETGALAVKDGRIAWVGPMASLPADAPHRARTVHDFNHAWVTPGLVDCHTHLVYAGNRVHEFESRLNGATYEEIARAGGGILSTVQAVRKATEGALYRQSLARLTALQAEGVTTVEIKSGYGLDTASELKMLRIARDLGRHLPVTVSPTFLGAHALPPEFGGRSDAYIDRVVREMLPAVAEEKLAVSVDVFCERIAFTPEQTERVFAAALDHGLGVKLHAEQLSDSKGAVLAARYGAWSVDHLEYIGPDGVAALAGAGTVAVMLPGAFFFLNETRKPPVDLFREHGVPMAVATDCNPGSSPTTSPLLMMHMACVLFGLTPAEALAGYTVNGARALGLADRLGTLEAGKQADLAVWDIDAPADLAYRMGGNPCRAIVKSGAMVDCYQHGPWPGSAFPADTDDPR
jgi:imidazolonepropionase